MDSLLRDINRERSKMQSDIENLHRHYDQLQGYLYQYLKQATVDWAKVVIDHPRALLLIVETTRIVDSEGDSYGGDVEPVRLTSLSLATDEMWDQLLFPTYSQGIRGTEYHGLVLADLEGRPRFADAWPSIAEALKDHHIIIFGADWALQALRSVHPTSMLNVVCLHNKCKEYYAEFYDLSVEKVLGYQGVDMRREQLKDSRERIQMLAQIVKNLAVGMEKRSQEAEPVAVGEGESFLGNDDGLGDLDDHPF